MHDRRSPGGPAGRIAVFAATALADPEAPEPPPTPAVEPAAAPTEVLHNIVYRARVDGVSRGATITYAAEGDQVQTANPTMVPGRTFEANTRAAGLAASEHAGIDRVAVLGEPALRDPRRRPVVAQAEDFIAPRLTPNRDDPGLRRTDVRGAGERPATTRRRRDTAAERRTRTANRHRPSTPSPPPA